jgi:hypothetical protein
MDTVEIIDNLRRQHAIMVRALLDIQNFSEGEDYKSQVLRMLAEEALAKLN